jgi:anthranilate phosphoribosyltransferase
MNFALEVLNPLVRGTDMERTEAQEALAEILAGRVEGLLIASFLTALTAKGETADEMTGFVDAMVSAAATFSVRPDAMDIVGTGGDQLHTVNISTMASLAVAGCGVAIAKHGNRAASSSVGSADILEALGVRLDAPPDIVRSCIEEANIGFMFAPTYHHALGYLVPIRRALNFRTIFNVLGPLANPAMVQRTLIGVAQPHLMESMAQVLHTRGVERAVLVNGDEGLDELSLGVPSTLFTVTNDGIEKSRIDAGLELGRHHDVSTIKGGQTDDNLTIFRDFLEGKQDPIFDVACANAGLALMIAGKADSLVDGYTQSADSVINGHASRALNKLIEVSNS